MQFALEQQVTDLIKPCPPPPSYSVNSFKNLIASQWNRILPVYTRYSIPNYMHCYMHDIIMVNKGTRKRRAQWSVHPPKITSVNQNYNTRACSYTNMHVKFQNIIFKILFIKKIRQLKFILNSNGFLSPFYSYNAYHTHIHHMYMYNVVINTETHFQSCDSLDSIFECFHAYWRCF